MASSVPKPSALKPQLEASTFRLFQASEVALRFENPSVKTVLWPMPLSVDHYCLNSSVSRDFRQVLRYVGEEDSVHSRGLRRIKGVCGEACEQGVVHRPCHSHGSSRNGVPWKFKSNDMPTTTGLRQSVAMFG